MHWHYVFESALCGLLLTAACSWLALASALLVFPVVPLLWESFAAWRRADD